MRHIQIALVLAAGLVSALAQPADAQGTGSIAAAALHNKNGGQRP